MRLYKRDETWWLDVTVSGQRYRMSLDTSDKRLAKGRANERICEIEQGKFTKTGQTFAKLPFAEASNAIWKEGA